MLTYIQQAKVRPKREWRDNTILGSLKLDYMGSAEFEFGALPKALARFLVSPELKTFGSVKVKIPSSRLKSGPMISVTIGYLTPHDKVEDVEFMLRNWTTASRSFKEWNVGLQEKDDFCFAIDQGAESFFWRNDLGRQMLMKCVKQSRDVLIENNWISKADAAKLIPMTAHQLLTKEK